MKQKIFTLVMMFALVILAGSVYGLNDISVYQGGTYSYSVSNVSSTNDATAAVSINPSTNTIITQTGGTWDITGGAAAAAVTFTIKYGNSDNSAYATTGAAVVTVVISDDVTGCSNSIQLNVTVNSAPSLTLAITGTTGGGCQAKGSAGNNTDEYAGGPYNNDLVFTVGRSAGVALANVASMSYNLNISETGNLIAAAAEGNKAKTAVGDHTVSFNSTEGAGTVVTAAVQSGGTFTMDAANGGATYSITAGASGNITVNPVPTIGSF